MHSKIFISVLLFSIIFAIAAVAAPQQLDPQLEERDDSTAHAGISISISSKEKNIVLINHWQFTVSSVRVNNGATIGDLRNSTQPF